jgi:sulfite exporter TauE/SafE
LWPLLGAAVALGLAGSVHCVAMCGGIAAAAGSRLQGAAGARAGVLFNLGRVTSYALLGLIVGAVVGTAFGAISAKPFAFALRGLAALLMLALGLQLMTGRDWLGLERLGARLWRRLQPLTGSALGLPGPARFFALGALWGFLPCGLVYSALALAAAGGSATAGTLAMLAFGAGTLPSMVGTTLAGSAVMRRLGGRNTRKVAGGLMIVFAAWTALGPLAPHGGHAHHETPPSAAPDGHREHHEHPHHQAVPGSKGTVPVSVAGNRDDP